MVHDGDTGGDVATTLAEAGVVKSFGAFYELLLAESPARCSSQAPTSWRRR